MELDNEMLVAISGSSIMILKNRQTSLSLKRLDQQCDFRFYIKSRSIGQIFLMVLRFWALESMCSLLLCLL